jgi:methionyl aminopeptidase
MVVVQNGIIKNDHEIGIMREAGRINAEVLEKVKALIQPGVTTQELDEAAEEIIRSYGATPTFKGYPGPYPYPATLTVSLNEEMVHGIPSGRVLKEGEIISVDCGTTYKGFIGDSAFSAGVGKISSKAEQLLKVTEEALYQGIAQMKPGNHVGDVSAAIQTYVEGNGFHVPRKYTGHGVGRSMHEPPQVPNFGVPGKGLPLQKGMTIAIEPMVLVGTNKTKVLSDKWTVISEDRSLTAHFEHTVAITEDEPLILTRL